MHEELKLIDVTIDDGYRFGLRILRFIIGKRHSQTLGEYIERQRVGKRVFMKAPLCFLGFFFELVGEAIAAILGGV